MTKPLTLLQVHILFNLRAVIHVLHWICYSASELNTEQDVPTASSLHVSGPHKLCIQIVLPPFIIIWLDQASLDTLCHCTTWQLNFLCVQIRSSHNYSLSVFALTEIIFIRRCSDMHHTPHGGSDSVCSLVSVSPAGWLRQKGRHWWEGNENGQFLADGTCLQLFSTVRRRRVCPPECEAVRVKALLSLSVLPLRRKRIWSQSSSRSSRRGLRRSQKATRGSRASPTGRTWTALRWLSWSTKATPSRRSILWEKRMNWLSSTSCSKATERSGRNSRLRKLN